MAEALPVRSGRDADYAAFVGSVWGRYLRLAVLLTGDRHRAEELLQDSLVALYRHWLRVSAKGDPHAYLRRALVNGNVSSWRRRRRERLVEAVPDHENRREGDPERRHDLQRALMTLPAHQRAVVVLRHYGDLTEQAVATALGCSIGTVKSQNARAMGRLREQLADYHVEGRLSQ